MTEQIQRLIGELIDDTRHENVVLQILRDQRSGELALFRRGDPVGGMEAWVMIHPLSHWEQYLEERRGKVVQGDVDDG